MMLLDKQIVNREYLFCKATILCSMFIFMLYFVCDISKKKHKRSTAVLFEYLKWLNFCSVNKKKREN